MVKKTEEPRKGRELVSRREDMAFVGESYGRYKGLLMFAMFQRM